MTRCKAETTKGYRCKHSAKEHSDLCGIHESIHYNPMWGEGHPGAHSRMLRVHPNPMWGEGHPGAHSRMLHVPYFRR